MKRKKTEQHFGVPPEEIFSVPIAHFLINSNIPDFRDSFIVHKSAKKGQNSFRITKSLLDSLFKTYKTIQKKPILVITIADGSDEYTITCSFTKK
jgi:hypothetical protein